MKSASDYAAETQDLLEHNCCLREELSILKNQFEQAIADSRASALREAAEVAANAYSQEAYNAIVALIP